MTSHDGLAGKRILVIEDEYFIASDLKRALKAYDADVVGPAGDLDKGLSLLADEQIDAAVLDINLEGDHSYPIADRLAAAAIPYMFLTGYDGWSLPESYRAAPCIAKPSSIDSVLNAIERLVAGESAT